jgi:hypothetical protein
MAAGNCLRVIAVVRWRWKRFSVAGGRLRHFRGQTVAVKQRAAERGQANQDSFPCDDRQAKMPALL